MAAQISVRAEAENVLRIDGLMQQRRSATAVPVRRTAGTHHGDPFPQVALDGKPDLLVAKLPQVAADSKPKLAESVGQTRTSSRRSSNRGSLGL